MSDETKPQREWRMAYEERFNAWRKLLPDSRLANRKITIPSPIGDLQPLFCLNCGAPHGAVTTNPELPDVTYICPSCAETHGGLPVPEVPVGELTDRLRRT